MSSEMLRQRIIFLYKRGISINNIVWIMQIRRDDVKRVIREADLFNMKRARISEDCTHCFDSVTPEDIERNVKQIESDLNKKLEERGYLYGDEIPVRELCDLIFGKEE